MIRTRRLLLVSSALGALCAACGGEGGRVHIFRAGSSLTEGPARTLSSDDCAFGESMRVLGDLDGDRSDDLLLDPYAPKIGGAAPVRRIELERVLHEHFFDIAAAGDTDADGRADLVVGGEAGVRVFRRGLPPDADADVVLVDGDATPTVAVASVGDIDRDGFADVAALWPGSQRTDIYLGGIAMDSVVDVTLPRAGDLVASAGDFNSDGFADVLIGGRPVSGSTIIQIYWGGRPMDSAPDLALVLPHAFAFFEYAFPAGDLNGDGETDLVTGAGGNVIIYFGGPGADGQADLVLAGRAAAAGDLDGDGLSDLAVTDEASERNGRVRIFLGGPAFDDTADLELTGDSARFGSDLGYMRSFDGAGPALVVAEQGLCLL